MGWVPEKFKQRPFWVWGGVLITVASFVGLFGRDRVAGWIESGAAWAGGLIGG